MSKLKPFVIGSIVGASCVFVALQYHIVRTHDGFQMVPRTPQHSIGLAYADIRDWNAEQWADRPELARALVAHGSSDMIASSVTENLADSITSENSTLDQLRSFISDDKEDSSFSDSFTIPEMPEWNSTSGNSGAATERTDRSGSEQDSLIPFPRATFGTSNDNLASNQPDQDEATERTNIARRPDISIDDVFRSGSSSRESGFGYDSTASDSSTTELSGRMFDRDSMDVEGQLFGDDDDASTETTSDSHGYSPAFTNESESDDSGQGTFGEITRSLDRRAADALARARSTFREQASDTISDSSSAVEDYLQSRLSDSISNAGDSGGFFSQNSGNISGSNSDSVTSHAMKALEERFDPFLDWKR